MDPLRSRAARDLAERALVRLVRAYGGTPDFVLLGGLVPDLLCRSAAQPHIGTTDIDVQVDFEIQSGAVSCERLERALVDCGFKPDGERVWQWRDSTGPGLVVKIEFLSDLPDVEDRSVVAFDRCQALGAVNLRGTGFAARDSELHEVGAGIDGAGGGVLVRVATLPGYLLAKTHAARSRGLPKDWYDIAWVLINNDAGGPRHAGDLARAMLDDRIDAATESALRELAANFHDGTSQGSRAYAQTAVAIDTRLDPAVVANDSVAAVQAFVDRALGRDATGLA